MKTIHSETPQHKPVAFSSKPQPLTPELLRSSSGLHELTDEQAGEIIDSLYVLARILLTVELPENTKHIDNQYFVSLERSSSNKDKAIPLEPITKRKNKAA